MLWRSWVVLKYVGLMQCEPAFLLEKSYFLREVNRLIEFFCGREPTNGYSYSVLLLLWLTEICCHVGALYKAVTGMSFAFCWGVRLPGLNSFHLIKAFCRDPADQDRISDRYSILLKVYINSDAVRSVCDNLVNELREDNESLYCKD